MKYKDTMQSPRGVLKLTVLKSGPKLIGDFSFPATCWWGPHPQRLGHGRASLRKHRHRCSWHWKFHSLTSMFFWWTTTHTIHGLVYLPTLIIHGWIWMVWVMNILNYSMFKSHLPSNRLKFCNLKIAPGATAIAWDREPHQQIHHSWQGVYGVVEFFQTSPTCEVNVLQWYPLIGSISIRCKREMQPLSSATVWKYWIL